MRCTNMVGITELRKVIAKKTNLSEKNVKSVLDAFFKEVVDRVNKGDKVAIKQFGVFMRKVQKAKKAKNPRTKAVINVPQKKKFVFKASKKVKYQ
ncbi:MAG: HU family DNA-binding protein [Thermoplasmata archaeon]